MMTPADTKPEPLSKRLKAQTHDVHEGVDRSIMTAASFANLERYGEFLCVQYLFHRDVDALYGHVVLQDLLPGLAERRRLPQVEADLADLNLPRPATILIPVFRPDTELDIPGALGWLYVAEGSNMGAALLRKEAAKLALSDSFGARHLAPASEGPAAHWRAFTAGLDAAALTDKEEARAVAGAQAAFARVQAYVDERLV